MKMIGRSAPPTMFFALVALAGCSSSDGGASRGVGGGGDVVAGRDAASMGPTGSGGSIGTSSIRPLSTIRPLSESALDVCADIEANKDVGSCPCDQGSVRYEIPHIAAMKSDTAPDEVDIRLQFDACRMNGHLADGTLAIQIGAPAKDDRAGMKDMLLVANMKLDSEKIAVAFAIRKGELWYSQDVDADGKYVLVKLGDYADGSGEYTVHADNGDFACDLEGGSGVCTNDESGEKIRVADDGVPSDTAAPDEQAAADDTSGL